MRSQYLFYYNIFAPLQSEKSKNSTILYILIYMQDTLDTIRYNFVSYRVCHMCYTNQILCVCRSYVL